MADTAAGTRVYAVREIVPDAVYAFGYGTYLGDQLRPGWDSPAWLDLCEATIRRQDCGGPIIDHKAYADRQVADGKMTRAQADARIAEIEAADAAELARPLADRVRDLARRSGMNPLIELERGGTVWGFECWWGPADDAAIARFVGDRQTFYVPARDRRAERVEVTGGLFAGQLPDGALYAGRPAPHLPGSEWANPFRVGKPIPVTVRIGGRVHTICPNQAGTIVRDAEHAVELYRALIEAAELEDAVRAACAGRRVACWCKPPSPCHVDVLVAITNGPVPA